MKPQIQATPGNKRKLGLDGESTMKKRNATSDFKQRVVGQSANGVANPDLPSPGLNSSLREKLLITGDDILIEYVHRLMVAVQSIKESMIKPQWNH